ncbi:ASPRV1 [Cordylochernes scorpioides]|uniref:ASPRV1 n=1 Tax=Cordylochernes scorpioides TaxID=51811 RepID=A0ABY6LXJ8_9ARAC|nr:ASPRV1 [Cordylochernes scorpioides]
MALFSIGLTFISIYYFGSRRSPKSFPFLAIYRMLYSVLFVILLLQDLGYLVEYENILAYNINVNRMVETRSGKMQDPAQERIKAEESAKPQPGATIGRDASSDPVVLNPNIDIPKYDGTEDSRPWIESLEEIGFLYHWADYIISRYAAMNMIGSAKTWLNLHKVSFTSWENFKSRLIEDFASDANKEEMRMRLNRIQQWNEPAIRFAEDILVLCNKVDPQMEEETKINWVIGGLKKEYSFALHLNPPKNTNELLEICKKLDLFEKNYQERAEKSKALYNGPRSPSTSSCPHHQEQWKNATSFRRPYQNTSKPQAPAPRYYQNTSKPQAPTPRYYQNKPLPQVSAPRRSYTPNPEPKPVYPSKTYNKNPNSNRNRTEDGSPICFKCNKPGHVARYCRVRFVRIVEEDPIVTQDKVEEEIRMDNGTQKSRPLLYSDVSNSPYSSIPTRNRYAALEDLN